MKIKGNVPSSEKVLNVLDRLLVLSDVSLAAVEDLKTFIVDAAKKKSHYETKKAVALIKYKDSGKSQDMRDAHANDDIQEAREESYIAEALKVYQTEKVKTLRQTLSALQTFVNSEKSVADMLRFGQDNTP